MKKKERKKERKKEKEKALRNIGNSARLTVVCVCRMAFRLPLVCYYVAELCANRKQKSMEIMKEQMLTR
jgi:hypothetical protein